ncbi:MAG: lipoyl synthase [Desulfovibrio sp.]|jgi:lipoic acid synthetase|nr:lipoyl synthase [Desulfovibrio sp.]
MDDATIETATEAGSSSAAAPLRLEVLDMGRVAYGPALEFQKARVEAAIRWPIDDTLLLVEHEPVVTMGRGGVASHLHVGEAELARRGAELFWVERGGMATFHGPGQLVAYPVTRVRDRDLHAYMDRLLAAIADTLRAWGLEPVLGVHGPGVWVNGGKIASVGVAVRKWTTYHGMALNVSTDMDWFSLITPCGNPGERMTSMARELGRPVDMKDVADRFTRSFAETFGCVPDFGAPPRRPDWLTVTLSGGGEGAPVEDMLSDLSLHTVCQEARCPNKGECFARGTATFIILGDVCTRGCRYCAVTKGRPLPPDPGEPERVAEAVARLRLRHAVITSVTRDDLPDGGAEHFAKTIRAVRRRAPGVAVEVLVPDFSGDPASLAVVLRARPDVFNHNIETVRRRFPEVRPGADYDVSLLTLARAAEAGLAAKSGIMLGLGETCEDIHRTLGDLARAGCRYLTLGQYLAPTPAHAKIARYLPPEEFDHWRDVALALGFQGVASAPLVRSSYRAEAMPGLPVRDGSPEQPLTASPVARDMGRAACM